MNDIITIYAPPSKSISHRYLIGAALADGESLVWNTLESDDLVATRDILCAAGAKMTPIEGEKGKGWRVMGMAGKPRGGIDGPLECDARESGTTCRLLTAVLAAGEGLFRIFGGGRLNDRPIGELCEALQKLGCGVRYEDKPDHPPIILDAKGLNPALVDGYVQVDAERSSQFYSGALLAAPMAFGPLSVELAGRKIVSWPYVGLTLRCMSDFGVRFSVHTRPRIGAPWIELQKSTWKGLEEARPGCFRVRVWPGPYRAGEYSVEGDWSGASYFLAAGAIGKKPVRVVGINADSAQGDRAMLTILRKMGAEIKTEQNAVTVYPSELHGVSLDMSSCPDLAPTAAVLAAFAKGSTRISNVAHLRLKESDRIAAPATELAKTGVTVDALSDGLLINGLGGPRGFSRNHPARPTLAGDATLSAHNDHRIAMSLALLELRDPELNVRERLDDPEVVRKSFPSFWDLWSRVK